MSKQTYMMESLTRELILRRMEDTGETMREAMSAVYNSKTYAALNRPETGLYFQSPVYVYDCIQRETYKGKIEKFPVKSGDDFGDD